MNDKHGTRSHASQEDPRTHRLVHAIFFFWWTGSRSVGSARQSNKRQPGADDAKSGQDSSGAQAMCFALLRWRCARIVSLQPQPIFCSSTASSSSRPHALLCEMSPTMI